jgi:GDPmannose 4,6-dehydratase
MGKVKKKIALIFGVTGQDGSYLAELLLKKDYIIHGVKRRSSSANTERLDHIFDSLNFKNKNFFIHYGDVTDSSSTLNLLNKTKPDEIYNLAAQSHVRVSFDIPEYTANSTAMGALRILESMRILGLKRTKYYQASSSEMFGKQQSNKSQNEKTSFHPMSIYGVSKVFAYHTSIYYRDAFGIFASNGILFNHESPRRGPTFVTKKIVQALVRIKLKKQQCLTLGNLYAVRDWGHAKDYVESMWKILQYKKPDDWVIATNEEMTVKEFINKCAKKLKIDLLWKFKGIKEIAVDKNTKKIIIKIDKKYFRPGEVDFLKGDYSKAKKLLKWKPRYKSDDLINDMIEYEKDLYE